MRPCPRYRQGTLLELLRSFRVERSQLLRNGVQEYLFEFIWPHTTRVRTSRPR